MRVVAVAPEDALDQSRPEERLLGLRPSILALARARLHSFHDAQDAFQETCLRVLRSLNAWRPEAPFEHWVFTIAANVIRDMVRKRQTRQEAAPPPAGEPERLTPEQALQSSDDLDRVRRAIDKLDPSESAPLLMHLLHGVPQREIASHLDIPVEHLRVRLYRAIRKIRKALKE